HSVVIGKDTRLSGDMLEAALCAGVASTGINVLQAGIIPTPGVAFLCAHLETVGAGIVISASHNPYEDNGIKIFRRGGEKLSDEQEENIENFILSTDNKLILNSVVGTITPLENSLKKYADFLLNKDAVKAIKRNSKKKLRLVIDCSNGAASKIAPMVFNNALFETQFIHHIPDGKNINDHCGSQHTEDLAVRVLKEQADIGLAFDGDADRLIVIDEKGNQITGDRILAICAQHAKQKNRLENPVVVSTIMSNIGLTQTLDSLGITHIKADVGDRKVLEQMKASKASIGGEDSGHMIFLNEHSTGDGMLSALMLLKVMSETQESLSSLSSVMNVFPQVLMNVNVDASRPDFMKNKVIADTIKNIEEKLGSNGRVLIRYSGTQPLLRVMVEGPEQKMVEAYCEQICLSIKENL
ncbi:MAG: phosphoglucosamine mutase, partial [Proteobacteria bacterium]|nr:phosphoglucosamine mutase [Pseudomonadota bacterium]